jgi:hypothetical protein
LTMAKMCIDVVSWLTWSIMNIWMGDIIIYTRSVHIDRLCGQSSWNMHAWCLQFRTCVAHYIHLVGRLNNQVWSLSGSSTAFLSTRSSAVFFPMVWARLSMLFVYFQPTRSSPESGQEELNDLQQIHLPTINRTVSRSSLNAIPISTTNNKANNTTTVTTAIVTMPSSSTNSDAESMRTPSTCSASPQNPNVCRVSTL